MVDQIRVNPRRYAIPSRAVEQDAPAANTAAVVTFAAVPNQRHVISKPWWSYDGVPTGQLTVYSGGVAIRGPIYITSGGPGWMELEIRGALGQNMRIELAAGGAGVSGSVGAEKHWTEGD